MMEAMLDHQINGRISRFYEKYLQVFAALPLIRAAALEEAAQVADDEDGKYWYAGEHRNMVMLQQHGYEIAAAIRALKEQPLSSQEGG
jgi:hypothetical protein